MNEYFNSNVGRITGKLFSTSLYFYIFICLNFSAFDGKINIIVIATERSGREWGKRGGGRGTEVYDTKKNRSKYRFFF